MFIVASQNKKTTLLGRNKQQFASILRWMSFANQEVILPLSGWFRPFIGFERYDKRAVEVFSKSTHERLGFLEKHLTRNTYLVGDSLSLADIFFAGIMTRGFASVLDSSVRAKYPAFMKWHSVIINQPFYKAVNQPVLIDEARKFDPTEEAAEPQGKK